MRSCGSRLKSQARDFAGGKFVLRLGQFTAQRIHLLVAKVAHDKQTRHAGGHRHRAENSGQSFHLAPVLFTPIGSECAVEQRLTVRHERCSGEQRADDWNQNGGVAKAVAHAGPACGGLTKGTALGAHAAMRWFVLH